jgi:adenylate cyclase
MVAWYPHRYLELARVVIIDIDDKSLFNEGRWPWPRDRLADLLIKLQEAGVVVAGMDIVMSDPEINYAIGLKDKLSKVLSELPTAQQQLPEILNQIAPQVDNDQQLAQAMKNYDVTLGFLFHDNGDVRFGVLPPPLNDEAGKLLRPQEFKAQFFTGYNASLGLFIEASGHGGFVTNLPDPDGVIRHGLVLASINDKVYPSLALMISMRYLLAEYDNLVSRNTIDGHKLYGIQVGGTFLPTNAHGQILIPFWGPQFTLPYYSATDILHGKVPANELEGSIAIVGSSALVLRDLHSSPVARLFPGVEMVGNMVAAILGQQVSTQYDWQSLQGTLIWIAVGSFFALVFPYLSVTVMWITTLCSIIGIISGSVAWFFIKNLFVPGGFLLVLLTLLAIINYAYAFSLERRQKHKIQDLFGQYVPENYIQELLDSEESSTMEGKTRKMTVLFSDINNFASMCEELDAPSIKNLLNTFLTPMTEIIFKYHGTIDKYVGDMIVAFWGAPIPAKGSKDAYQAIMASLSMQQDLPKLNGLLLYKDLPTINIGIGLGTGIMSVGDMGSKFRRSYTVLGDVVNLASRLEGLTRFYKVAILVNEDNYKDQDAFLWRIVDKVRVKGRKASLLIYEPLGLLSQQTAERVAEVAEYHQAQEAYFAQQWEVALPLFQSLEQRYPNTYLYKIYIDRVSSFQSRPPPEGWDGSFRHDQK